MIRTDIQLLVTPDCPGCKKVERILDSWNVKYDLIDVTKDQKILEKYFITSAPGIIIDGKLEFVGVPNENELKKKLSIR